MTTRTANVLVTKSKANGMATAAAARPGTPAASAIGTAAPENASAADASPSDDSSRPLAVAAVRDSAGRSGNTRDQRTAGSMARSAPVPAAAPMARQQSAAPVRGERRLTEADSAVVRRHLAVGPQGGRTDDDSMAVRSETKSSFCITQPDSTAVPTPCVSHRTCTASATPRASAR
jgi:hypothetical protein